MPFKSQILFFSDFEGERDQLGALLQEAGGDCEFFTAADEQSALDLLAAYRFDFVFAWLRGGPLAAIYFLNGVWDKHPHSSRFVLSGEMLDSDALVRCALGAHQYIRTPVDAPTLKAALARAEEIKDFVRHERMRVLVSRMRTLPTRPSLYMELMRELRSSNASAAVVGDLVAKDLAISTKLIQVANSVYYGVEQQVSEPGAAVLLLGLETTASLVLSIEAFARFDKLKPLYFSIDRVWKHSQAVADLTRKICQVAGCDAETTGHAYTAGLLHDIGKLALAQNFEEQYHRTVKRAEDKNVPLYTIEREVFGATHPETGAYLLAAWGLPLPIVRAVADHHLCPESFTSPFSASTALHLAEQLIAGRNPPEDVIASYPKEAGVLPHLVELCQLVGVTVNPSASKEDNEVTPRATVRRASVPHREKTLPTPSGERARLVFGGRALLVSGVVLLALLLTVWRVARPSKPDQIIADQTEPPVQHVEEMREQETPAPVLVKTQTVAVTSVVREPELKLQAVLYNGDKSAVIINGVLLRLGDSIEGARVSLITPRRVTLQQKAGERTLQLD